MSKKKAPKKPESRENPPPESTRKSTNPKTPDEQIQAIADDIKSELIGWIYRYILEQELVIEGVERALGIGGGNRPLEDFINELESGFKATATRSQQEPNPDKETMPELKRVSEPARVDVVLPSSDQRASGKATGRGSRNRGTNPT